MLRRYARNLRIIVFMGAFMCLFMWLTQWREAIISYHLQRIEKDIEVFKQGQVQTNVSIYNATTTEPAPVCQHADLQSAETFYNFVHSPTIKCYNMIHFPRLEDDSFLEGRHVCVEPRYLFRETCLVYIFGGRKDSAFAEQITQELGCSVFIFDTTASTSVSEFQPRIHYYNITLHGDMGQDQFSTIVEKLGHQDVIIDLLWIDLPPGRELRFLEDIFASSTRILESITQIGIVVHPRVEDLLNLDKYWKNFELLYCEGFRLMDKQPSASLDNLFKLGNKTRSKIYELLWARED